MALFFECMPKCVRKVLDTADIVRDACYQQFRINRQDRSVVPFHSQVRAFMSLDKIRRRLLPIVRVCFFVVGGLLLAGMLFLISVTHLDGPHSRQHAHEAVAVGKLHTVIELQSKYAAAHADKGFACELPLLKPIEQRADADYDPAGFLATGTWSGYRVALDGCQVDKGGVVAH